MKGNPHAESVSIGVENIRNLIGRRELYQRDGLGIIVEAQSRMAIAHEQRTANLINLLGTVPMDDQTYDQLRIEVMERVGHGNA
jgi:hypothetical protein